MKNSKSNKTFYYCCIFILILWLATTGFVKTNDTTDNPTIHAIIFYSPTCGHCQKVLTEDLPPLQEKYSDQLVILSIDVSTQDGQTLYLNMLEQYQVPQERMGVPTLVVGETVLVGAIEIPETFPLLIEEGIQKGGIPFPEIPGIEKFTEKMGDSNAVNSENKPMTLVDKFSLDILGNSISTIVLLSMIASILYVVVYRHQINTLKLYKKFPNWTIPLLAIIGLMIALYMGFVEVTNSQAVCGPIGDCNSVQQSKYANLFGIFPVGVIGLIGYIAILIVWLIINMESGKIYNIASLVLRILVWVGIVFCTYLTFLEPFVIGATCLWCLGCALTMLVIFWTVILNYPLQSSKSKAPRRRRSARSSKQN
jgi:uncharacterized membrane protein